MISLPEPPSILHITTMTMPSSLSTPSPLCASFTLPALRAEHLTKRITRPLDDDLVILEDVSFTVAPGQRLAIVGASGSGKSTLLGLLAGLDLPTHGEVWYGDMALSHLDEEGRAHWRAQQVGFVFQAFHLLPQLTALENVMLPLELIGAAQPRQLAGELLTQVGLGQRFTHYPAQLSGGEQQRVAIARAFATRPRLLFADEPTGNLDQRTGERISALLFDLNQAQGTTLVLVTHDPVLAARCERQVRLEAGRLVEG